MYRATDKLSDPFRQKVEAFMRRVGDHVMITESWRSKERQKDLYAQGRTKPGNIVTWTLHSKHMDGAAIDLAFVNPDGSIYWPSASSDEWEELANVAREFGIKWPYRDDGWGVDAPHFEDDGKPLNPYDMLLDDTITLLQDLWPLQSDEHKEKIGEVAKRLRDAQQALGEPVTK